MIIEPIGQINKPVVICLWVLVFPVFPECCIKMYQRTEYSNDKKAPEKLNPTPGIVVWVKSIWDLVVKLRDLNILGHGVLKPLAHGTATVADN